VDHFYRHRRADQKGPVPKFVPDQGVFPQADPAHRRWRGPEPDRRRRDGLGQVWPTTA